MGYQFYLSKSLYLKPFGSLLTLVDNYGISEENGPCYKYDSIIVFRCEISKALTAESTLKLCDTSAAVTF